MRKAAVIFHAKYGVIVTTKLTEGGKLSET